ncbi:MAG: hypothetical protein COV76_03435 [Candidatus Omnitrophica bacterium CG11_big_fil_rev_8_21_14_0_20_64_10]|nr:MAG: hypothetical protein COV76_03435 [Candidatus Omnitrophica bacterium CG11_big_fil_rev_8_21_14_0_20_64_10]
MLRKNTRIVAVHFTGDPALTYEHIKREHLARGLAEVGFHYFIKPDGTLLMGRNAQRVGAHSPGEDEVSLGICVLGDRHSMAEEQSLALTLLLDKIRQEFPEAETVKYFYREPSGPEQDS